MSTVNIGSVLFPVEVLTAIKAALKLGHRVRIEAEDVGQWHRAVTIVADAERAEPVVCVSCKRTIAQSWMTECPECEGPLRPEQDAERDAAIAKDDYYNADGYAVWEDKR
jgi:uncharacterized protein with PIN domain